MLIPFFLAAAGWREYRSLSLTTFGAIVFLGVGASGLGYLLWYAALERLETSQVAAFLYLEPLVTLAAAVVLLGEPVAVSTVLGGVLVLAGVLAVQSERSGKDKDKEDPCHAQLGSDSCSSSRSSR
jgi:drug/metabolite transporter (DMT)-like permease